MTLAPLFVLALSLSGAETPAVVPAITRAELSHTVSYLASDELEGRATASEGIRKAAEHLAQRMQLAGLKPGGPEDSWFQVVPMERGRATAMPELSLTVAGVTRAFALGVDYEIQAQPLAVKDLRLVYVSVPEQLPETADPKVALVLDGSAGQRREWLAAKKLGEGQGFGLIITRGQKGTGRPRSELRSRMERIDRPIARQDQPFIVRANGPLLEALQQAKDATLSLDTKVVVERMDCRNVIGRIDGVGTKERPELAETALVLSAHYDHIGLDAGAAEGADRVHNGADDDASGCAMMLEIAGVLAAGEAPARDVLVFFATAEEIGLLGTEYYLDHPLAPLDKTVANLNFEMVGRPDPKAGGVGKLWFTGHDRTNLQAAYSAAGLAIVPDPYPDQSFFERSDNYAFVKRGVVGQTLSSYNLHKDYHHVSDEVALIDFEHLELATREALHAVRMVADGSVEPLWLPGRVPTRPGARR